MNSARAMTLPKCWQGATTSYSIRALVLLGMAILSALLVIRTAILQGEVNLHDQSFDPIADFHYMAATDSSMDAPA